MITADFLITSLIVVLIPAGLQRRHRAARAGDGARAGGPAAHAFRKAVIESPRVQATFAGLGANLAFAER